MSQISEYFVAAFRAEIDKRPRGTKTKLAALVCTTPSHITDILHGRKYGSEEMKRALSEALGWSYEEFLKYGKCLIEGKDYKPPTPICGDFDLKSYAPVPLLAGASASALALGALKGSAVGAALAPVAVPALGVAVVIGLLGGVAFGGFRALSKKLKSDSQKTSHQNTCDLPPVVEPLPLLLYKPFLGQHQNSNHLLALPMNATNMEPTIPNGAIVIVDMSDRQLVDGKIFMLVSEDQQPFVTRVRQDFDSILLTNDNPAYPPKVLKQKWDEITIGKIIMSEHTHY